MDFLKIAYNTSEINEVKFTDMENKIKEILQDYMTERQIELALPRLVNLISFNLPVIKSLPNIKCSLCDFKTDSQINLLHHHHSYHS